MAGKEKPAIAGNELRKFIRNEKNRKNLPLFSIVILELVPRSDNRRSVSTNRNIIKERHFDSETTLTDQVARELLQTMIHRERPACSRNFQHSFVNYQRARGDVFFFF